MEAPFLQDVSLSYRHFPEDIDFTMLADMKAPGHYTFLDEPQPQYVYQDYLGTSSTQLMFPQQLVYAQQAPVLTEMFELVEPVLPVVMAPDATTYLTEDELQTSTQEIMRMCLQDSASSDGYGYPPAATTPADATVSSTLDLQTVPAEAEVCTTCFGLFTTKVALRRHVREVHRPRHVCDVCGRGLATPRTLRVHKLRHTGVKPFTCQRCGASFYERSYLRTHERTKHPHPQAEDNQPRTENIKDVLMDVGLQVVHQHGGGEGGGVVFKRAPDGEVVGIVATPRAVVQPATCQGDKDAVDQVAVDHGQSEDGIVLRLVRCKNEDGAWKVINITKF